jgi:hypothetical protein
MPLSGEQFKALRDALVDAFDYDAFEQMLRFELDKILRNIVEKGPMNTVAFRVIDLTQREGWTLDLVHAARVANPGHAALHQVAQMLLLSSTRDWTSGPMRAGGAARLDNAVLQHLAEMLSSTRQPKPAALDFEKVVRDGVPFLNPAAFRSKLGRIELQVCSVELDDVGQGSGLLVGPGHVLTNQHVVANAAANTKIACRFDFAASADGKVIDQGIALDASRGVLDSSPPSGNDPNLANGNPTGDELDYALLRLERDIGHEPAGSGKNLDAPARSWTQLAAGSIGKGDPILVLQHPQNPVSWNLEPLKLTMGRTLDIVADGLRLRHDANTLPGSSGSPCFSASLALVALHHAGGDSRQEKADYNQAIPIAKIIGRLERSKVEPFWKEAPPA